MLSHHLHTNTYNDIEIYGIEPYLQFLPFEEKNWIQKYAVHVYIQLLYLVAFLVEYAKKILLVFVLQEDKLRLENLLPLLELLTMQLISNDWNYSIILWMTIHAFSGFWLIFTSLIASHHHPEIYHAGDIPRPETDWGLRQMDSVRDITQKKDSFFLVATTFGHHTLHHLFPTVDHSKLHLLYPILEETCREFNIKYQTFSQWQMFKGMHQQLMRTKTSQNYVGSK